MTEQTLSEIKRFLQQSFEKGVDCPACGQWVQRYQLTITSTASYQLILLYKYFQAHPGEKWVHVGDYLNTFEMPSPLKNTGGFAKLKYWDLIVQRPKTDTDVGRTSGQFGITEKAKQFVQGMLRVPKHALVFDNKFLGYLQDHQMVGIKDTLQQKFNYNQLMGRLI